jgi:hypothetical protein
MLMMVMNISLQAGLLATGVECSDGILTDRHLVFCFCFVLIAVEAVRKKDDGQLVL